MYRLYKLNTAPDVPKSENFTVKKFKPDLFNLLINSNEKLGFKSVLLRLYFYIITKGEFEIYYVESEREIIHTSYVLGKCFKFNFMKKGDFEIGPCHTVNKFRGRGIYPCVLKKIYIEKYSAGTDIFMFVNENNTASIKGFEKAGFIYVGQLTKKVF